MRGERARRFPPAGAGTGSDARSMRTAAVRDGDGYGFAGVCPGRGFGVKCEGAGPAARRRPATRRRSP
ncbi:hypothetical protein GCM10010277_12070 [Streptomyces longisporoflavus]|nr:hypothetical protein GCM10010277_12070 [Streptomyces longisporoflavus]